MTRRPPFLSILSLLALGSVIVACGEESSSAFARTAAETTARAGAAQQRDHAASVEAGYRLGAPDAPIAVVEFSDFGCPYCGRFASTTFRVIHREYIDAGLVRWRYVPVSFGFAGGALMGAAAECAGHQAGDDGFWRAHEMLYRHQSALRGPESQERMLGWLEEAGLDGQTIAACLETRTPIERLTANNGVAEQWGVRGTPTFVINGVPMSGALPTEFFRKVLDTALDPSGL